MFALLLRMFSLIPQRLSSAILDIQPFQLILGNSTTERAFDNMGKEIS